MSIIKNGNKIAGNYKIQVATEATTEKSGAIRIATEDEAKAGILDNVAITPKQLGEVASSIDVPPATQDTIGLVKPDGETIIIDESGTISAITSGEYTLPTASTDTLGGVKVDGETITINDDGQISSVGGSLPMFAPIWADHLYNDASYLRADTFSWHSGDIYVTAYNILLEEYNNENCVEEIENGIVYKRTPSGFKIANADQNDIVLNIYNDLGIAWYYIIDTTNKQFKLPRTKYGFNGLRDKVGGNIDAGLPTLITDSTGAHTHTRGTMNITGTFAVDFNMGNQYSGAFFKSDKTSSNEGGGGSYTCIVTEFDASRSWAGETSSNGVHTHTIEGNSDTVQPPATQMYLYFYVGNYKRPETEINVGILTELANDLDINTIVNEINTVKDSGLNEINTTITTGLNDITDITNDGKEELNKIIAEKVPVATVDNIGLVKPDGNSILISSDGTLSADIPEVALATLTSAGLVQPDGTSISILNGVISAIAQGGDEWEYSLGTNSYFKHKKSGFMIQCGYTSWTGTNAINSSGKTITFPKPYPTKCCACMVNGWCDLGSGYKNSIYQLSNPTTTSFNMTSAASGSHYTHWIAVGY